MACSSLNKLRTYHSFYFDELLYAQNSDGSWAPIIPANPDDDPYQGPPSADAAEECGLPFGASAAYRCLQCRVPAANPLLQHNSSSGMKATATVSLAFASEAFQVRMFSIFGFSHFCMHLVEGDVNSHTIWDSKLGGRER